MLTLTGIKQAQSNCLMQDAPWSKQSVDPRKREEYAAYVTLQQGDMSQSQMSLMEVLVRFAIT